MCYANTLSFASGFRPAVPLIVLVAVFEFCELHKLLYSDTVFSFFYAPETTVARYCCVVFSFPTAPRMDVKKKRKRKQAELDTKIWMCRALTKETARHFVVVVF